MLLSRSSWKFPRHTHLPRVRRAAAHVACVLSVLSAAGCAERQEVTITDFAQSVKLVPPSSGKPVVGLMLEAHLRASAPIQLHLGCKGKVDTSITVPNNQPFSQRLDWYSDCAEASFSMGSGTATSMTLRYQFQTL